MWTSFLGMNPNCLYAEPRDWTQVTRVLGEAAKHYTNNILLELKLIAQISDLMNLLDIMK